MPSVPNKRATRAKPAPSPGGRLRDLLCRTPGWLLILPFFLLSLPLPGQPTDLEIPYSSVFRDTGGWPQDPLRNVDWNTDPNIKVGDDSLRFATAGLGLGTNLDLPFDLSGPPPDAMFRFWRLYLDIPSTYLEIIASDNADQTKNDREKGIIAVVSTDFNIYLQLTERLQLTAAGRYIYLPFANTGGFQGSSFFNESFGAGADVDANADFFIQATFDGTIGETSFFVTDTAGLQDSGTSLNALSDYDARLRFLEAGNFDKADRLGRYSLGGAYHDDHESDDNDFNDDSDSDTDSRWDFDTGAKYNRFSLGFFRDLPTDTRASLTLFRSDTWDDDDSDSDHDWTHGLNASLRNQHPNMRFKPYLTYTTSTSNDEDYWQHVARLGFAGPITDYTDIDANVGYTWNTGHDAPEDRTTLWYVSLHNELNELTTHRLSYSRSVEEPNDEIHTTLAYSLHRTLGPRLEGTLYATWTEEDESGGQGDGHDETTYNVGAGLTWDASSRLTVRLTAFLTAVQEEDTDEDYEEYSIRLSADYSITDTTSLDVSYEHVRRDHERNDRSYYENVLRARLTKQW